MNRKNTIAVIIIVVFFGLCLWFLYPSYRFYSMSVDERQKAIQSDPDIMKKVLNLGLDLQGGMHLVYEVDRSNPALKDDKDLIDRAYTIIENRVNYLGVAEPNIQKQGTERLIVELPGLRDPEAAKRVLGSTGQLEFNLLREPAEWQKAITVVDRVLKGEKIEDSLVTTKDSLLNDSLKRKQAEAEKLFTGKTGSKDTTQAQDTIAEKFTAASLSEYLIALDEMIGVEEKNKPKVDAILKRQDVQEALNRSGLASNMFLWGHEIQTYNNQRFRPLYYLKKRPELTGDILKDAQWEISRGGLNAGMAVVNMEMNREGARKFSRVTGANVNKFLAIILDSSVYSAPRIKQKIPEGRAVIEGRFTNEEAKALAVVLRAGALPAPLQIVEERTVGPSLGQDSIELAMYAMGIGFLFILAFMVFYYRLAGFISCIALLFNVIFVVAVMASIGSALTLPGIGGLILTIGMAIDANVIIYERIREELAIGKTVRSAIDAGYARAFITIMDSNITTLITFFVILWLGTGPVKGFAITSILGIIVSLFTAIYMTHTVFNIVTSRREITKLSI